jgi:hypothetical protein
VNQQKNLRALALGFSSKSIHQMPPDARNQVNNPHTISEGSDETEALAAGRSTRLQAGEPGKASCGL